VLGFCRQKIMAPAAEPALACVPRSMRKITGYGWMTMR
jgi:hypothetical protein